jgi:hypothetical protein
MGLLDSGSFSFVFDARETLVGVHLEGVSISQIERLTEDEVSATSRRRFVLAVRDWHCADQNEITIFVFSVTAKDWRVIVGIAQDLMKERFAYALYGDALAARPADLHCVRETP